MLLGKEGDKTTRDSGNRHAITPRKPMSNKDLRKSPAREYGGRRLCAHNEPEKSKRGSYRRPMSLTSRSSLLPAFGAISLYSKDVSGSVDSTLRHIRRCGSVQALNAAKPVRGDAANSLPESTFSLAAKQTDDPAPQSRKASWIEHGFSPCLSGRGEVAPGQIDVRRVGFSHGIPEPLFVDAGE